jgi:membrane associated rhomboid family serine protease
MLACPNCQKRLAKQPSPEGPRWLCGACGGRAIHLPSLRCTPAGAFVRRLWALARSVPAADRKRPCPMCDKWMATVPTLAVAGSTEPLRLDLCISCQFVWFDPTEHEAWLRSTSLAATDERLPAETRAALARLPPDARPRPGGHEFEYLTQYGAGADQEDGFELKYLICLLGLPVEVDPPPLHGRPWATWILAGLVTAVTLAAASMDPRSVLPWAFVPAEMWRHGGLTLITSFFLHGSLWHLASNMYFLVVLGDNVEDLLGWPRYLALLLMGTVAGNLCHAAVAPSSAFPAVGASGGIAAVILFYGLQFPHGRLKMGLRFLIFDISVWAALVLWVTAQLIGTLVQARLGTKVGYAAHLGGALTGLIFWVLYERGEVPRALSKEVAGSRPA